LLHVAEWFERLGFDPLVLLASCGKLVALKDYSEGRSRETELFDHEVLGQL
jgi:hypothetical protein